MNHKTIAYAFRASLPVMAGYLVLGIGFGILMQSHGYAWYWATVMSIAVYAGSMQYIAVDLLAAGANMITFALMTLVVNARHIFYGLTMLTKYKNIGKAKPYLIFALTDETFSLVCDPDLPKDVDQGEYDLFLSLFDHCYWIVGSTLGALLGRALVFDSTGVDFTMTALFVVIVLGQWEKSRNHLPAITGFVVSAICLLIFGPADFLIPSMLLIAAALLLEGKFGKAGETDGR